MKSSWKSEFASRFRRHEEELKRLHRALYHGDQRAYDAFEEMLYRVWRERPDALRQMDREREDCPGWYRARGRVGMWLDVGAFAGTLAGLRERLDHIADCGVNCLYLSPLLEGTAEGAEYAVSDYRQVRPELGSMADLRALSAACRERGITVGLDFPLNHTSDAHPWARRARAGEQEYQNRYFFYDSPELPNAYEQTMPQELPIAAPGSFTWCPEAQRTVMTTFYPHQWDLNYMNPAVLRDMTENLLYLCNQGADMIRLEAMPCVWKALGTPCRDLPQTHMLVRLLRIACDIVCPGVALIGDAAMSRGGVAAYFGAPERPECHLVDDAALLPVIWHTVAAKDARLMAYTLEQALAKPREHAYLHALHSRDGVDWKLNYDFLARLGWQEGPHRRYLNDYLTGLWPGSPSRGEIRPGDLGAGRARLHGATASLCGVEAARKGRDRAALETALRLDETLHALLFTLSGAPVLYGGDEIAMESDPAVRGQGGMDWKKAEKRARLRTAEGKLFAALTRLQALRAAHPAFDPEADAWILDTGSERILGVGRYAQGEKLLALFNFAEEEQIVPVREPEGYTDLISGKAVVSGQVKLPARGFCWLLHRF